MRYIATYDPLDSFVTPNTIEASPSANGVNVEHPKMTVIALGGFGGRVDQSFHSVGCRMEMLCWFWSGVLTVIDRSTCCTLHSKGPVRGDRYTSSAMRT